MFTFDAGSGFAQNKFLSSKVEIASVTASSLDRGFGHARSRYPINTEFRLRIPAALSCSSRWSAPRRALIKS